MDFNNLYQFLEALQKNNNKVWMDANRKWYTSVRNEFIHWLDQLSHKIEQVDPEYNPTSGRKAINRINNNLLFHPNKPVYKDHFGAGLDIQPYGKQNDFYVQVGLGDNVVAGGFWHPDSKQLRSIREAIDYNGEVLIDIVESEGFTQTYGSLLNLGTLIRPPKGFPKDHQYIELLKKKSFAAEKLLTRKDILDPKFQDRCVDWYLDLLPFRKYLAEAVSV